MRIAREKGVRVVRT